MNNFIDKLERRFGRHPIHNLMLYVCILYMIGLVVDLANPTFCQAYLSLNPQAILHGQIWRLVTFLMSPPDTNVFFFIFTLYLYYILGRSLERTWGAFRFNLYYFSGVIFTIIASFIAYFVTGQVFLMDTYYINMSIFFAFAMEYPDMELLFMFLIPIKIKWLAYLDGVLFVISFITGTVGTRIAIAVAMLNFLIYFITVINPAQRYRQHKRRSAYTKAVHRPERTGGNGNRTADGKIIHRCAVCGRTNITNPELEFRFCSKCNGNYEYCQDHLFTHEHVK